MMKKIFIRLLSLSLLLCTLTSIYSCASEPEEEPQEEEEPVIVEMWSDKLLKSDSNHFSYESYFANVETLLREVKKNPDRYNNAKIKIIGTLYKKNGEFKIVDFTADSTNIPSENSSARELIEWEKKLNTSENIDIIIGNDAQYAVAEKGDYVKLYGTIRLTRNGIYIDDCEYSLIATLEERRQNIKQREEYKIK